MNRMNGDKMSWWTAYSENYPSPRLAALGRVILVLILATAVGTLSAIYLPVAVGVAVVAVLLYLFARSGIKAEIVVGAYWISFCLYETVLTGVSISGFFYPFYVYFLWSIVEKLVSGGIRLRVPPLLIYIAFMLIVLMSFVGFKNPVGFEVIQRLVAYSLGVLVALQFASTRGLYAGAIGFILGSVAVSVWVIAESVQSGFAYRAGISVNQNDLSAVVAIGLIAAIAITFRLLSRSGRRLWALLPLIGSGLMLYGLTLLASRGMTISVVLAVSAMFARVVTRNRRAILPIVAVLVASASILLLPGGDSIIERFDERNLATANLRSGLWSATWEEYTSGDLSQLLLGWGFDSNKGLLRREFGWTTSTHNAYLQILFEFGVVGLLCFVTLLLYLFRHGWRAGDSLGLVLLGLSTFLIGSNLSSNGPDGFVFWIMLGYAIGIANGVETVSFDQLPYGQRGSDRALANSSGLGQ